MTTIKMNSKTLATQSGTDEPVMASGVTGIPATGVTGTLGSGVTNNITTLGTVTAGSIASIVPTGHVVNVSTAVVTADIYNYASTDWYTAWSPTYTTIKAASTVYAHFYMMGHASEADWGAITHEMKYDISGSGISNLTDCGAPNLHYARPNASSGSAKECINAVMAMCPVVSSSTATITYVIKIKNTLNCGNCGWFIRGNDTGQESHMTFWEVL